MNPIEDLRRSDPAFRDVTPENVSGYFAFIVPHLLISEAKHTGAFEVDPIVSHVAGELGEIILQHFTSTRDDSNKYNLICHYLMDQVIITRNPVIHQVVILDLVMDTSAYRLHEMADCRVYELELNAVVLAEKERLLRQSGDKLLAKERYAMLTPFIVHGWQEVLLSRGFNPDEPTLWIIGSSLSYMTVAGGADMVSVLESLSAPGSQIYADIFAGHTVKMTDQGKSVVTVNGLASFEMHGDNAVMFQELSQWTVELLARRDDEFRYYGSMWNPDKLDKLRVTEPGTGYLGPWFIVRFTKPGEAVP